MNTHQVEQHGSVRSYIIGFILSLALSVLAYWLVANNILTPSLLVPVLITLGVIQMIVQLIFFLHLGQEKRPRWNLWFFLLTVVTILTVVLGALWIMEHLNTNMMPEEIENYIIHDEGLDVQKQHDSDH